MAKFDMGAAWDDAIQLLKAHRPLTGTIAAVFLFLPALAVAWFGPAPIEPPAEATIDQLTAAMQQNILQMLPYQIGVALFTMFGTVAIMRLWLSRSSTSVGEALGFAASMLLTILAVQILTGLMLGVGFLLLIIPGLYLIGRLAFVAPLVADRAIRNPAEVIATSWQMTRGNGWRIFLFLFLVTLVVIIAASLVGGLVGMIGGAGSVGKMLGGLVEAGFGLVATMISIAISAAAYRQLATTQAGDIFA